MSVPGGGNGAFQYSVTVNIQNVEAATRRLEQLARQTNENMQRNLSVIARIDTSGFQTQLNQIAQAASNVGQQTSNAFNAGGQQGVRSFQQVQQQATATATQIGANFTNAANTSAQSWTTAYNRAFQNIQNNAQRLQQIQAQQAAARPRALQASINAGNAGGGGATGGGGGGGGDDDLTQTLLGGAARGALRGLGLGAGVPIGIGFTAAAAGAISLAAAIETVTRAIKDSITAAFEYNSQIEKASITFRQLTGDVQNANAIIADLRKYADITPFNTQEVLASGEAFIRVTHGSREEMAALVNEAGKLATVNPEQGLKGATYAIRELLSGDVQSIADRFNVSRTAIRRFMEEGKTGLPLIQAVTEYLGVTNDTVKALGQTFEGRSSTVASFFANFGQAAAAPMFKSITADLGVMVDWIDKNAAGWIYFAETIGVAIDSLGKLAQRISGIQALGAAGNFLNAAVQAGKPQEVKSVEQQVDPQIKEAKEQAEQLNNSVGQYQVLQDKNKVATEQVTAKLSELKLQAAQITAEYERQLLPLQRQLELLQRPNFNRERQRAGLSIQEAQLGQQEKASGPSTEARAEAAANNEILSVQERLQQIENRRKEIAEQRWDAEHRGKTALEQQAESLADQVKALQRIQQAQADIRAQRIEGLRDEQQAAQDVRAVRIEGIREEQRQAQQARNDKRDAIREERQLQEENYQAATRAADRAHQAVMQNFNDEIDRLRDKQNAMERANRGTSPAEQQLEGLDRREQDFQNQKSLFEARRAVAQAPNRDSRNNALENLRDLEHNQAVGAQRQKLQDQIKAEREKEEQQRFKIEDQIAAIQKKAQADDRAYQRQKQTTEIQHEQQVEAQRIADRNQDKADKAADRAEQNKLRAQEVADRAVDRAEQAKIRAQEKADKDAERVEKEQLRKLELAAEQAKQAAEKEKEARELARQIAADQRQEALNKIELVRMANEEKLLLQQDTVAKSQQAAARVRLEDAQAQAGFEAAIEEGYKRIAALNIQEQIFAIKDSEALRLDSVKAMTSDYQLQAEALKVAGDNLKYMVDNLKDAKREADATIDRLNATKLKAASMGSEVANDAGSNSGWQQAGINMAASFLQGWTRGGPIQAIADAISLGLNTITGWFVQWGKNAAANFINGWNELISRFNLGGGGNQQQQQQQQRPTTQQQGGGGYSGTGYSNNYGNGQQMLQSISARAYGGSVFPGRIYKVNEDSQYMEVFTPGTVSPTGAAYAGGSFGSGNGRGGISIGSIKIDVDASKVTDPRMVGQIVNAKVQEGINQALQEVFKTDHAISNPAHQNLPGVPIR